MTIYISDYFKTPSERIAEQREDQPYNTLLLNNDPYKQISNYQRRLEDSGQEVPQEKHRGLFNALMGALDILDRPANAIRNVAYDVFDDDSNIDVWGDLKRGITGQKHVYGSDILGEFGVKNRVGKTVGGFALDVLLDPVTYVTGGTVAGLRGGISKGITKDAGREAIEKELIKPGYLDEADLLKRGVINKPLAQMSNQELSDVTLREAASKLGGGKPIDPSVASMEDVIKEGGWQGLNPDLISQQRDLILRDIETTGVKEKRLNRDFAKVTSSLIPGLTPILKQGTMQESEIRGLMRSITDVINDSRAGFKMDPYERATMTLDMLGIKDAASINKALDDFSDVQIRLAGLFQEAFGLTGKDAWKMGTSAGRRLENKAFPGINLSQIPNAYKAVVLNREAKEGFETALHFANGLEQVYNKTLNTYYLKFMGMPFMNVTKQIGDRARVLDFSIATSDFVKNNPVGQVGYGVRDALGYMFNTEYVTKRIARGAGGMERYERAKDLTKAITTYTRRETALAQQAKQIAETLFADILDNPKLRRAVIIGIEGMGKLGLKDPKAGLDATARKLWVETAADLTDEELNIVEDYILKTRMFANTLFESDASEIARSQRLAGKELTELPPPVDKNLKGKEKRKAEQEYEEAMGELSSVEKLQYRPITDYYAPHMYKDNRGLNINDMVTTQSERQQLMGATSLKKEFMNKREFKSLAQAEEHGGLEPVYDVVAAYTKRIYESRKLQIQNGFAMDLEYMIKNPEQFEGIEHVLSKASKEGMVQLPDAYHMFYATPEVRQNLTRLISASEMNAGSAYMKQIFDKFTNVIKTFQTSLSPSFLLRNIVGETMMNWFANVSPAAHDLATKILQDKNKASVSRIGDSYFLNGVPLIRKRIDANGNVRVEIGKAYTNSSMSPQSVKVFQDTVKDNYSWSNSMDKSQIGWVNPEESFEAHVRNVLTGTGLPTYKINGKDYLAYEIMDKFYENGLGWSGITKGNLIENMQDLVKKRTILNTGVKYPTEYMKGVGDFTETWTRLAHFVDRVDNGLDWKSASNDVRLFHVDYRDLTTPEKEVFRRIAPYYTYMRKNTPIQVRQLLLNPGKFQMISHLIQESYNTLKDDAQYTGQQITTPDYLKENLAIPWDIDNNGNIHYMNWNLPIVDVARLQGTIGGFMDTNLISMLHPLVKAVPELYMNRSMTTDAEISRYEGESAPLFSGWDSGVRTTKPSQYILNQLGVINTGLGSLGQIVAHRRGEDNPGKPFVGYPVALSGTKSLFPTINSEQARNSNAYRYRDQLQDYVKMLQEEQGIEVPELPRQSQSVYARLLRLANERAGFPSTPKANMPDPFMERFNYYNY